MPYEVVTALAHELSVRAPTVFVLEDVHWADEATLDVLRLLARRVETVPALVVASYRDDGLDRAHPLRILLGELTGSRAVRRMKLVRLSPVAVAQPAEPYGIDADELYRKTGGNPFFVVEALAVGAEGSRTRSGTPERGHRVVVFNRPNVHVACSCKLAPHLVGLIPGMNFGVAAVATRVEGWSAWWCWESCRDPRPGRALREEATA